MAGRWKPPPMKGDEPEVDEAAPKVRVDEKVVRKMLKVNPEMRDGRTTFQVKQDLEAGQAVKTDSETKATGDVPKGPRAVPDPKPSGAGGARGELEDTIGFFIRGKAEAFDEALDDVAERRQALEAEEEQIRAELRDKLASFVAMLDPTIVATHGVTVLSKHKDFLARLGITTADLLASARKANP